MRRQIDMFASLNRIRAMTITLVFGPFCRLNQREIGVQWGEAEWTARDLW